MNRYTIWRDNKDGHFCILGTYAGNSETDALNALAKEEGHADIEASHAAREMSRDNYKVKKVS